MKTIIVPTDFSPAAINATNYAADMALQVEANILLLHVYQIPVAITDTPLIMVSVDELKEDAEAKLDKARAALEHVTSGKLKIKTEARLGIVTDELEDLCKTIQPFAVVMGTTGHSAIDRIIFGSNTLSVIKHLTWPVICVPRGKEYGAGIKKVGLACDYREVEETTPFAMIRDFVNVFGAELHILNVSTGNALPADLPKQSTLLESAFNQLEPRFHFIENSDIEDGINEFAEKNNIDLMIAIPKKHKLLQGLFRPSSTRQLVFESHVPVLCIHE